MSHATSSSKSVTQLVMGAALALGISIAAACGSSGGDSVGPGNCPSAVDSVKSVTSGVISAFVSNRDDNASYILLLGGNNYVGTNLQGSSYVLFTGLPLGTFTTAWLASGCHGDTGEDEIPGPQSLTIQ